MVWFKSSFYFFYLTTKMAKGEVFNQRGFKVPSLSLHKSLFNIFVDCAQLLKKGKKLVFGSIRIPKGQFQRVSVSVALFWLAFEFGNKNPFFCIILSSPYLTE